LFNPRIFQQGIVAYYNIANDKVFKEAHEAKFVMRSRAGTSPSDTGGVAAIENISVGVPVELRPTQYISDNASYWFIKAATVKPIFQMVAEPMEEAFALKGDNNSDSVRTTDTEYAQWRALEGYGVNMPMATIGVTSV